MPPCDRRLRRGTARLGLRRHADGWGFQFPAGASSSVPGVFFAAQRPGGAYMTSEIRGELLLDGDGCLRVRSAGGRDAVVWPAGFEPDIGGGEVRVLDGEGRTVARVGGAVYMGGGETGISDNGAVDDRTERELRERCPGPYWIAAPPVSIPGRG